MLNHPSSATPAPGQPGRDRRFTAYWHDLLDHEPELAQRVLDHLADRSGLPRSRYLTCTERLLETPSGGSSLVLHAEDYAIICEHRLEPSRDRFRVTADPLIAVPSYDGRTFHTIIAKDVMSIPGEVSDRSAYLKPQGSGTAHYLWEELYPLVRETPGRLPREFDSYMHTLGLDPWTWAPWGDPFADAGAAEQFRSLWEPVLQLFRRPGAICRQRPTSLGLEVLRPIPGIHLLHVGPRKALEEPDARASGRVLRLCVFGHTRSAGQLSLDALGGTLRGAELHVHVRTPEAVMPDGAGYVLMREYFTPLSDVLLESRDASRRCMLEFVRLSMAHLEGARPIVIAD
jgi:hypothetical protein